MGSSNPEPDLAAISTFFELGDVVGYQRLGGYANTNFSVQTTSGSYVVKWVQEHSAANLATVGPLFEVLKKCNFPAAVYLRNSNGDMVFDNGSTVAVAMREEKGAVRSIDAKSAFFAGETLAQLHSIPCSKVKPRLTWFHPDFIASGLGELDGRIDPKAVKRLHAASEAIGKVHGISLRRSIVHGDYHPGNLLFNRNRLTAVLDWEEATYGPSVIDIAYVVFIVFIPTCKTNIDIYSRFIAGYQSVRTLLANEWSALPDFVRFVGLTVSIWLLLRYDTNNPDPAIAELTNRYWTADLEAWKPPGSEI